MARYTKLVLLPVFKTEVAVAKQKGAVQAVRVLHSLKKAVTREALIDKEAQQQVRSTIAHHQALDQVYQFKARLQTIWDHRSATQKELLDALQHWCVEAEQTGVKALREFSAYLKAYSIKHHL